MKNRLIGGVIVGIITLAALFAGGAVTAIILLLCSLVGVHEILKVYDLQKSPFAILDYAVTVVLYVLLYLGKSQFVMPMLVLFVLLTLAIYVIQFPKYKDADMMRGVFAFLYASILLSFVLRIRSMEAGLALSFFVLISSWINDIFAYFVGSAIGKHKFSPKVSPNKSVEGFIGGVLGAGLIGFAYGTVFAKYMPLPGVYCAIIAALDDPECTSDDKNECDDSCLLAESFIQSGEDLPCLRFSSGYKPCRHRTEQQDGKYDHICIRYLEFSHYDQE